MEADEEDIFRSKKFSASCWDYPWSGRCRILIAQYKLRKLLNVDGELRKGGGGDIYLQTPRDVTMQQPGSSLFQVCAGAVDPAR
jgi:hypothetical protein